MPLPKESCQISDDKVDQNNINFVKKFNLFKSGIVDDFDRLEQAFFSEVNRFKEELLKSNVVSSEKTPQVITQSTVDLVKIVANDNLQVTVSSIVPRNDQWSKKVYEVNKALLNLCIDVNIPFISHSAIDAKRNLNNSKLHLNIRGSRKLPENFVKYLKGFSS